MPGGLIVTVYFTPQPPPKSEFATKIGLLIDLVGKLHYRLATIVSISLARLGKMERDLIMIRLNAFIGLLSILLMAQQPCFAQDCAALLSNGIYDYEKSNNTYLNYSHIHTVYCSKEASTYQRTTNLTGSADVPIADLLVGFGFGASDTGYSSWQHELCNNNDALYYTGDWNSKLVKNVDQGLINAYVKCQTALQGLIQYIT